MARTVESAQALDIHVEQLTGSLAFVANRRRRSVELLETTEAGGAADTCGGRHADGNGLGNLSNRLSLLSQREDSAACSDVGRRRRVRARAAIGQGFAGLRSPHPLAPATVTHTGGRRRRAHRPSECADSFVELLSTGGATSRILVHVHPGPSSCPSVRLESFQIDGSRPDEQLASRNNVLTHHS
jgi:hypothetical protein